MAWLCFPLREFAPFGALATILAAERERWLLWLPVGLGAGIALYFALPVEPARWLGPLALAACLVAGRLWRRRQAAVVAALGLCAVAAGFTLGAERARAVAHPVLERPTTIVRLSGRIADVEPLEQGQRVTVDQLAFAGRWNAGQLPERIRLRLPTDGRVLLPGQWIAARARLMPPPMAAAPGAFDFARQAWFKRLGAVGYTVGPLSLIDGPASPGWLDRAPARLAEIREALARRMSGAITGAGLAGDAGAVAGALVTGQRGSVSPALQQAYRDAGLAHVLVIAGMHMSMVAGLVFVGLRTALAAIPFIALRFPIKKWTAFGALLVTLGYLVISGAPVPTQRAFLMNGIVLFAVLVDREAISLRSITWAATAVLVLQPEALVGASFQMSFAAVYGLIASYEALGPRLAHWRQAAGGWWVAPAFYIGGILLTSQIAGAATAFYVIHHFNRYATYSLLGNVLAVPIVGFWVMPAALLGFCLMPFGLDAWGWQLMGWGIAVIGRIALAVSSLPGATVDLPAMPVSALVVFTAGGLWLCLWRTGWRWWGVAGMVGALLIYAMHRPPDLLIDPAGAVVAMRGADGTVGLSAGHGDKVLRETWSRLAGQGSEPGPWRDGEADRLRCGSWGCLCRLRGHAVLVARRARALSDGCQAADIVVSTGSAAPSCPTARLVIDGRGLRAGGTHALWLEADGGFRLRTVADWQGDRLWSPRGATK
jgi:competence protein ComEC